MHVIVTLITIQLLHYLIIICLALDTLNAQVGRNLNNNHSLEGGCSKFSLTKTDFLIILMFVFPNTSSVLHYLHTMLLFVAYAV